MSVTINDTTPSRRRKSKKFLQEIVEPAVQETVEPEVVEPAEPEIQPEKIELQEVNWDDLNDRQREEIIQKKRAEDVRIT